MKKKYVTPNIQSIEVDTQDVLLRASRYDNLQGSGDSSDRGNVYESDSDDFEGG